MQLAAPQKRLGLASVTDEALLARERASDLLDVTAPRGVSGKRSDEANTLRVLRGDDSDLLVLGGEYEGTGGGCGENRDPPPPPPLLSLC